MANLGDLVKEAIINFMKVGYFVTNNLKNDMNDHPIKVFG